MEDATKEALKLFQAHIEKELGPAAPVVMVGPGGRKRRVPVPTLTREKVDLAIMKAMNNTLLGIPVFVSEVTQTQE